MPVILFSGKFLPNVRKLLRKFMIVDMKERSGEY
jgi:hypothetical protein